jgi:hypothetical protein
MLIAMGGLAPSDGALAAPTAPSGTAAPARGAVPQEGELSGASLLEEVLAGGSLPLGPAALPLTPRPAPPGATRRAAAKATEALSPVVTSITPTEGAIGGGSWLALGTSDEAAVEAEVDQVTILGEGFTEAQAVRFGGANASGFTVESATEIVASPPAHEPGIVGVCVVRATEACQPGKSELVDAYAYGPVIEEVSPGEVPQAGGTEVKLKGRGFEGTTAVELTRTYQNSYFPPTVSTSCAGGPQLVESFTVKSATELEFSVPTKAPPCVGGGGQASALRGSFYVTVTSRLGRSALSAQDRLVMGPRVTRVSPASGPVSGGTEVTIEGHGFVSGATTVKFGAIAAPAVTVLSGERLVARTPSGGPVGSSAVSVTTPSGTSVVVEDEAARFVFGTAVSGLSAHGGPVSGGQTLRISGQGLAGASEVRFEGETKNAEGKPETVTATPKVISSEELEVTVPESPGHRSELAHVRVVTPEATEGTPAAEGVLYAYGLPFVERVEPSFGGVGGGTPIKVFGRNLAGVSAVAFDPVGGTESEPAYGVESVKTCESGTCQEELEAKSPIMWGDLDERYDVVVTTGLGTSSPVPSFDTFSVARREGATPMVEAVEPDSGLLAGGGKVVLRGSNFIPGYTQVSFGDAKASAAVVKALAGGSERNLNEIIATVPPGTPGTVSVSVTTPLGTSPELGRQLFTYPGLAVEPASFQVGACVAIACSFEGPLTEFFSQAAARPPAFKVGFAVKSVRPSPGPTMEGIPGAVLKSARLDLPPGIAFDPQAVPRCSLAVLRTRGKECPPGSKVGYVEVVAYYPATNRDIVQYENVYNVEATAGLPALMTFSTLFGRVFIEGGLSSHRERAGELAGVTTGDYHEFSNVREAPDTSGLLMEQRLIFSNAATEHGFVTMPSQCVGQLTYHLALESYAGGEGSRRAAEEGTGEEGARSHPPVPGGYGYRTETATATSTSPTGVSGCRNVPFDPTIKVTPETGQSDAPDGAAVEVEVPQGSNPDSADPRKISVTLPEGMTIDPSAAKGLEACSDQEFGVAEEGGRLVTEGSGKFHEELGQQVEEPPPPPACPAGSKIGTFMVESPDLPEEVCREAGKTLEECPAESERERTPLEGSVYTAAPLSGEPQSGREYRIFLDAESKRLGVDIRLQGNVSADPVTGRLTTTVETPQLPFKRSVLKLKGGPAAPLANPLSCGQAQAQSLFTPYGEEAEGKVFPAPAQPASTFGVSGCASSPLPFSPSQATEESTTQAGASPAFTLKFAREEGQQYLMGIKTTLPEGLLGSIASVPVLCSEAEADAGTCPADSQIGSVRAQAGSGSEPLELPGASEPPGPVYLTEGYDGAPYGLSIVVPAEHVGPYDYGRIVTRAKIEVDPYTTRVTTTATPPTIVGGAPVRLREVTVALDRPGFMTNPTSCGALKTESILTGTEALPATPTGSDSLASPFAATGCAGLRFKPTFAASTSAHTSRLNGASLEVSLTPTAHQANLKEVKVTLPQQLVSRLETLHKACREAQADADILACPAGSKVASATLTTPLLPKPLSGVGILVSRGGAAFPDLDFVLQGDGIEQIEVSHTDIKNGVTSSTFPSLPDAPFTSFKATFPSGRDSLLAANESLCTKRVAVKKRVLVAVHHNLVRRRHRLFVRVGGRLVAVRGPLVRRRGRRYARIKRTLHRRVPRTLVMPTTLVGQNGVSITQSTTIKVLGCTTSGRPTVKLLAHRVNGGALVLELETSQVGTLTVSGQGLTSTRKRLGAGAHTVKVMLSARGLRAARRHRRLRVRLSIATARGARAVVVQVGL